MEAINQLTLLLGLAAIQGHAFHVLPQAYERVAKIGLDTLLLEAQPDQRATHEVCDPVPMTA